MRSDFSDVFATVPFLMFLFSYESSMECRRCALHMCHAQRLPPSTQVGAQPLIFGLGAHKIFHYIGGSLCSPGGTPHSVVLCCAQKSLHSILAMNAQSSLFRLIFRHSLITRKKMGSTKEGGRGVIKLAAKCS